MIKKFARNSKKGLTLPVAIVISIVLVIVASGLIFVALSSVSTTSVTVNGRQAFMDVRSALEYAESYYRNKVTDYAMIGDGDGVEYIYTQEKASASGANYVRTGTEPNFDDTTNPVKTYVEARYIPASGQDRARLKLIGYSHYADEFGNSGKTVSLSVTFTIGSAGAQRRVTVIDRQERVQYNNATDTIKLNLKMPIGLTEGETSDPWELCYYVWSYKDTDHAYADYGKNSYYDDSGARIVPSKTKLNGSEKKEHEYTNIYWHPTEGSTGMMVGQSNNWYSGDYKLSGERVNYFNVIFTSRGKTLNGENYYDSQLNEIFHLWYLFPDDKNVYFEFLNKPKVRSDNGKTYYTRYYTGSGWNGKDGLDDTMLVYLRNQKTTVHFRALNDNKDAYLNEISALNTNPPTISYIANASDNDYAKLPSFLSSKNSETECDYAKKTSGIKMTYEGCGWWVANIETKKTFNIRIVYKGVEYGKSGIRPIADLSAPDAVPETWLVLKERVANRSASEKYLEDHTSERAALLSLGESPDSYITIHAKNYNPDKHTAPKLSYDMKGIDSTDGKIKLYNKLVEVKILDKSDYENYDAIFVNTGLLDKAKAAYDNDDFVEHPVHIGGTVDGDITVADGESRTQKMIERADRVYQEYIDALNEGIGNLVQKLVDAKTAAAFQQLLADAKANYYDKEPLYDNGKYVVFVSVYNNVKTLDVSTGTTVTKEKALREMQRLKNQMNILDVNKLDKQTLRSLKDQVYNGNYLNDEKYEAAKRAALADLFQRADGANYLLEDTTVTTQATIDSMVAQVRTALSAVISSYAPTAASSVDFTRINAMIDEAQRMLDNAVSDFTDDSLAQLEAAVISANTAKDKAGVSQSTINSEVTKLETAMYRFQVIKPGVREDVSSSVAEGKTRIWFNTAGGYLVRVKKLNTNDAVAEDVTKYVDTTGYTAGTASGLSCITLTDATTKKIKLVINKVAEDGTETEFFASEPLTVESLKSTDYLNINYSTKKVTASASTVLFIPRKIDNKNVGTTLTVKLGGSETLKMATSANYYIARYPASTKKIKITVFGKNYNNLTVNAGEHVAWINGTTAKIVSLDEIYPKPAPAVPDDQPNAGGTIARADGTYEIRGVDVSGDDADAAFRAAIADFGRPLASDEMCLVFRGYEFIPATAKIYSFGNGQNADYPGEPLKRIHISSDTTWHYDYYIAKKTWDKFIVNDGNNGDDHKIAGLGKGSDYLLIRDKNGALYDYYLIEKTGDAKYSVTQRKHRDYDHNITDAEIQETLAGLSIDNTVVIVKTKDRSEFGFGAPQIHIWGSSGGSSFTHGIPQKMNGNFDGYSSYYYIEFPKTYDSINIKSANGDNTIGDTTLPKKTGNKMYDYYVIELGTVNGEAIVSMKGDVSVHSTGGLPEELESVDNGESVTINFGEETAEQRKICVILHSRGSILGSAPYMLNQKREVYTDEWVGETWTHMFEYVGTDGADEAKYKGYYYNIFSDECTRFSVATDEGGTDRIMTNIDLVKNPYTNTLYKYYIVSVDSSGKAWFEYYGNDDEPRWLFDGTDYSGEVKNETVLNYTDLSMAYVGGGKIRVKNASYYLNYSSGKKNANHSADISQSNLFGGHGDNADSYNRLGNSKLLPYYDWYEYKIPVDDAEKYDFYIKGLDPDNTRIQTRTVENAYGNVWVSLFNNDNDGTVFTKAEISTFDIDVYQTPSNVTLYFKLPTGWESAGSSAVISAHGIAYHNQPAVDSANKSFEQLTRRTSIYKVSNISKYTPFITLKYEVADQEPKTYRIKLQGGDKVLFNPNANGGLGGWEDFVSDQDYLKKVCHNLLDLYTLKTLVSAYDDKGDPKVDATYHKSGYVKALFDSYNSYFTKPEGSSAYQLNVSAVNALSESQANSLAATLEAEYNRLNTLYILMSQARSYILKPLLNSDGSTYHTGMTADSRYPEYVMSGSRKTYENIETLRSKLKDAEAAYLGGSPSNSSTVDNAFNDLNRAIVNLRVSSTGYIAVVLYDAQKRVEAGHQLQLRYYTDQDKSASSYKEEPISFEEDINTEGYPILFIDNPPEQQKKDKDGNLMVDSEGNPVMVSAIYGVQFYDVTEGAELGSAPKTIMEADEAWVYMDYAGGGEWRENALTDFHDITSDVYKATDVDSVRFVMRKSLKNDKYVYEDMTLYFKYDTQLLDADGNLYYTIKSGAYTFEVGNVNNLPAYLVKDGNDVILDLFTDEAKTYFTTPKNYKMYTENAVDGKDIYWWNSGAFSTAHRYVMDSNVNLDVSDGSFTKFRDFTQNYDFSTNKGLNFRWSSPEPLYVSGAGVRFHAGEYVLGSVGEINATEYGDNGTHFYLYNYDTSANEMKISFVNDVKITYVDTMNKTHSFVIREGDYIIEKDFERDAFGDSTGEKTDYIADLFNETYWKSLEHVRPLDGGSNTRSWGNGKSGLSAYEYGN